MGSSPAAWPDQVTVLFLQVTDAKTDDLDLVFKRAFDGMLDPAASR
jgi:hypothetical protein